MSAPTFNPEQQAAIRAVLPAGAGDVRIEIYDDDGQEFADIEAYGVQRWLGELALALRHMSPEGERKCESGVEWALHFLGQLAMWHQEAVEGRGLSFKDMRDGWRRIAKSLQRELARRRGLELSAYGRKLRQMSDEVARLIDDCNFMAKKNTHPKNSHRDLIFIHLLDVWTRLGGTLTVTQDSSKKKTTGPLVLYFKCVASLVLGEAELSANTIDGIVDRERRRRERKPPRDRRRKK